MTENPITHSRPATIPAATQPSPKHSDAWPAPRRSILPFHPFLVAAFPILSLYVNNMDEVVSTAILRPLVAAALLATAIWILFGIASRDAAKGALGASAVTLVFFSYGHIVNLIPEGARSAVAPASVVGLACVLLAIARYRRGTASITRLANMAAVALVLPQLTIAVVRAATRMLNGGRSGGSARIITGDGQVAGVQIPRRALAAGTAAGIQPDIYYVILDAYGRTDSLERFLGIDNRPFVRALEQRGFYVASRSRSNYAQTGYCLPAYLNMQYLSTLIPHNGALTDTFEAQRRLIDKNAVADYLRARGYAYIDIWTGTAQTRVDTADLVLANSSVPPRLSFEDEVWRLSAAGAIAPPEESAVGRTVDYDRHRAFLLTAFHNLAAVPRIAGPKFVFAHILAPHPPFVFGPNGEPTNPPYHYNEADASQVLAMPGYSREKYREGYAGQLAYVNRRILEAIDAIQSQSSVRPIIIVQGDHGSRMDMSWTSMAKTQLDEPFSILNAFYVPDTTRKRLYPDITPVNSFRIVLDTVFGANYAPLPDRSYFATADKPLDFTDVTDRLSTAGRGYSSR